MKSDFQIQKDVVEELAWDPSLRAEEIGVAVKNGVVTLSGTVDSYTKKLTAKKDARRVGGVKAIAQDIQLGVAPVFYKSDAAIAEAVVDALKWHSGVQENKIKIKVEDGVVKLEGEVEWEYQRANVKSAIENLAGVKTVLNLVTIKPQLIAGDIHQKITKALERSAAIDAAKIKVDVLGNKVVLSGKVRSYAEKEDAEASAWNAPGVATVISDIEIETPQVEYRVS